MKSVAEKVLADLKDFQRKTVDYVFDRLYAEGGSSRFLVADEVGLGKTMIARGVIAKAIDHLRGRVDRIDIVYICSNADIARQNINRLRVSDEQQVALSSRLTLLPQELDRLERNPSKINFISFTPATSFELAQGLGRVEERVLLYRLVRALWSLGDKAAAKNVFRGNVAPERFRQRIEQAREDVERSVAAFRAKIAQHDAARPAMPTMRERFDALCQAYPRTDSNPSREVSNERYRFIGDLRLLLAASMVDALEPDLIILDEFQRFSHLLGGEDDASRLARELFEYKDVRVLLLSATPYKMYTTAGESEDHYTDFVQTVRFLERARADATSRLDSVIADYRESLLDIGRGAARPEKLREAIRGLQDHLRTVMVRTERLASTQNRNGMLAETPGIAPLREEDFHAYRGLQEVARAVDARDTLELWKSAPYLLSFVDDNYELGRALEAKLATPGGRAALEPAIRRSRSVLSWDEAEAFRPLEPGNPRMRSLLHDVVEQGAWKLLWVPPSLPYYRLSGAFAQPELRGFTKRLVFSSWRVVPRAVAAMVSYEVDRRMHEHDPRARNTPEARARRGRLLRFGRTEGRLSGMPVLALLYPSLALERSCDPAKLFLERCATGSEQADTIPLDDILADARQQIEINLKRLKANVTDGPVDERWYWAAPLLLDKLLAPAETQAWFNQEALAALWAGQEQEPEDADAPEEAHQTEKSRDDDAWSLHVEEACKIARDPNAAATLGRRPDDLLDVLAELAVAGPAVAMLRALRRVVRDEPHQDPDEKRSAELRLRNGAARIAWSFRALFNRGSVTWMLRADPSAAEEPYWRIALRYCAEGCLPAVLDEYAHVLRDHLGIREGSLHHRVHEIADEMRAALELRAAQVQIKDYVPDQRGRGLEPRTQNLACQFAARFADKTQDDLEKTRPDQVRKAFNSPFWPFVLATTSVGQEGLDFHNYCHAVVHWNLPHSPVDLEQREGRVHRFKGHAVRKNVAQTHGRAALATESTDIWESLFQHAAREAKEEGRSEIVPYWVYRIDGGAQIERRILAPPLSREQSQAWALKRSLAVYRMVFGQPRQDDLVEYLTSRVSGEELERRMGEVKIDLGP